MKIVVVFIRPAGFNYGVGGNDPAENNERMRQMETSIIWPKSNRALIAVGETGFKSTLRHNRATRFESEEQARKFAADNGVFNVEFRPATNVTHKPESQTERQEKLYAKLRKLELQAAAIADKRDRNEAAWAKAYEKARLTPGWKEHCAKRGCVTNYNYGDIIC